MKHSELDDCPLAFGQHSHQQECQVHTAVVLLLKCSSACCCPVKLYCIAAHPNSACLYAPAHSHTHRARACTPCTQPQLNAQAHTHHCMHCAHACVSCRKKPSGSSTACMQGEAQHAACACGKQPPPQCNPAGGRAGPCNTHHMAPSKQPPPRPHPAVRPCLSHSV